jgi:hypothetical protein
MNEWLAFPKFLHSWVLARLRPSRELLRNSQFSIMAEVFAVEILLELNERSSSIFVLSGTVRVKFI